MEKKARRSAREIRSETHIANRVINEISQFERQFKSKMATLMISAFGLVAALMWNDAIKVFIEELVPGQEILFFKVVAAVAVTLIAVLVTVMFSWSSSK